MRRAGWPLREDLAVGCLWGPRAAPGLVWPVPGLMLLAILVNPPF